MSQTDKKWSEYWKNVIRRDKISQDVGIAVKSGELKITLNKSWMKTVTESLNKRL